MARQVTQHLSGSPELNPVRAPEVTQVVARPVDQTVIPETSGLSQLVQALGQVRPALNQYLQTEATKQNEDERTKGAKSRITQTDPGYSLPPEASPSFAAGYKQAHGKMLADEAERQLEANFETERNKPDFNPEAFVGKVVSEQIAGVDDNDILGAYLPTFANAVDRYRDKFRTFQTEQIRENTDSLLLNRSRKLIEEAAKGNNLTREHLAALQQEGLSLNKPRSETNELLLLNAKVYGDQGHPSIYSVFYEPDENGIAPIDNKEFGAKVHAAVDHAQRVYEQRLKEEASKSDLAVWTGYKARIESEDPTLTVEEVFQNPSLNETDKRSFIGDALKLQQKLQIRTNARADILSGSARTGSLPPEHQQVYQDEFERLGRELLNMAGTDTIARKQALGQILTLGVKNGLIYSPMKRLLSSVDTLVSPDDKPGTVPPGVLEAAEYYSEMKRVNPAVAFQYTSESSKAFLDVFEHARQTGTTPDQAYALAVRMSSPESRSQNADFISKNQKTILATVEEELGTLEGTGVLGMMKDKTQNIEAIKSYVLQDIRNTPAAAVLGAEEAAKNAVAKFKATHVHDGNGRYLFVGLSGSTPDLPDAVKMYVDNFKRTYQERTGQPAGDYFLQPAPGGGDVYQVWDALGPLPYPPISRAEMLESYRANTSSLDLRLAQKKPDLLALTQQLTKAKAVNAELLRKAEESDADIDALYKKGGIASLAYAQYKTAKAEQQALLWGQRLLNRSKVMESPLGKGMGVDIPKVEMTAPTLTPKDGAKAVDIALRYQDSDPHFSLTTAIEGLSLTVYQDPAGGRAIGTGYNIDKRGEAQARKDLKAAMVPDLVVEKLLSKDPRVAASVSINPEQAARLYKKVQPEYEAIAKKPIGAAWDNLTGNQKAALTYLAYNTGQAYPKALAAIQKGDIQGAAKEMTIHYTDAKTGQYKQNLRAMEMVRSMFINPNRFQAQLSHMRGGWFAKNPDNYALQ